MDKLNILVLQLISADTPPHTTSMPLLRRWDVGTVCSDTAPTNSALE